MAFLLLGTGYGLCLRAGLLDLERWAPPASRGSLTGLFYLATYSGFAVSVVLAAVEPVAGPTLPLLVLGALAVVVAVMQWRRIAHEVVRVGVAGRPAVRRCLRQARRQRRLLVVGGVAAGVGTVSRRAGGRNGRVSSRSGDSTGWVEWLTDAPEL